MRTLIKTAGRTGSHVIAQQEMERIGVDHLYHNNDEPLERLYALPGPIVLHDHTKLIPPDSHKWDLIVSVRHSVYDQAVSYCIASATNNFGNAPASEGEFIVDVDLFIEKLKEFKTVNYYWLLLANLYKWNSVRIVYWEDQLPLDREYPLNYPAADKSKVVNHEQLTALAEKYIVNHNWAIDVAAEWAAEYIGYISNPGEILVGNKHKKYAKRRAKRQRRR